ncbi:HNH endonuclease [Acidihalobacter prosperus]|uniref:HNH endonuclease n=1 Tax=Acidihalobacter prosperus TaxID=160660 RepID=A0A1A6C340_9GAMM|nr:HNH endonuclease [Acidihalobacter prosperus]
MVHRQVPFVIRLKDRTVQHSAVQPLRVALDPGSRATGMALVREKNTVDTGTGEVYRERIALNLFELVHRGHRIREQLDQRRNFRRRRRGANLRYRAPRFDNRRRPPGWLAPSLQHRVDTTMAWVRRLCRWAPASAIGIETVRFDTQRLQNPEISGVEYQQGALAGCEVREYLLEKWGRKCAYCGAENVPLEIEHIVPKSRGGSDRVSNLALACRACNQAKGNRDVRAFLADQPERLARILAQAKAPLKDAAAVNATRWALYRALVDTGLPVEAGTGGRTKWNRTRLGLPKTHALDALCVGQVDQVRHWRVPVLGIRCAGRGSYRRTRLTRHGFPRGYLTRNKSAFGFQTGDLIRAVVTKGKKAGTYLGRIAIRASGSFNIQTPMGVVQGIHHRFCTLLQRADGYGYFVQPKPTEAALSSPRLKAGVSSAGN